MWPFSSGSSKEPETASPSTSTFDSGSYSNSDSHSMYNDSSSYSAGSIGGGRSLQEEIQMEAQKIEVQQMILQLTQMAFDKCVSKPGSSLSGSEKSCIEGSIGKYIDSKMFITNKLSGDHH
jgi:import inner membrane translocase subunit TIM13